MLTLSSHPSQFIPATCTAREPSSQRVLVVDDEITSRGINAGVLYLEDYDVETADDGADALERLSSGRFDLLVTGRNMRGLDGVNLIRKIRASGNRIPIVMVSGSLAHSRLPTDVANEVALNPYDSPGRGHVAYAELLEQEAA